MTAVISKIFGVKQIFSTASILNRIQILGSYKGSKMDLRDMRSPYHDRSKTFGIKNLAAKEPLAQFQCWFEEMCNSGKVIEPNAVSVATCTKSGFPSSRMVLMKGFGKDGFKFYTNYLSRKGLEMQENPNVALLFYWEHDKRQVRIEGKAVQLPIEDSEEYFHSRPRASQISAAVSPQSRVIVKEEIEAQYEAMTKQYANASEVIPRPSFWGGFRVIPEKIEFWQGQSDRFHDRIRFRKPTQGEIPDDVKLFKGEEGWVYECLGP